MTRDEFKTRITILVGLMSVFAALDVALSALPGWWISWAAIIKPLYGIMLGPVAGPCAAIIGGIIGNFIWPHTAVLAVFTWVPGILGALASGIIVKGGKSHLWTFALAVHAALISAFYLHPVGKTVALWALYDKVIALALIFPTVKMVKKSRISECESLDVKWLLPALALTSFIGTEADDITGNVIFMYLELYKLFGIPPEALPPLYVAGAVIMPLQRVLVAIIATLIAAPLFKTFEKSALIRWPLT